MKRWMILLLCLILMLCLICTAYADSDTDNLINKGIEAYKSGDYALAAVCFQSVADQGNSVAQSCLGALYYNGLGVEQSYEKAAKYYRLAADQGEVYSQYNLGMM